MWGNSEREVVCSSQWFNEGGTAIYICNCNGLNEHDINKAITSGARTYEEVIAYHGLGPVCRSCANEISAKLRGPRPYHTALNSLIQSKNGALAMREMHDQLMAEGYSYDGGDGYYK